VFAAIANGSRTGAARRRAVAQGASLTLHLVALAVTIYVESAELRATRSSNGRVAAASRPVDVFVVPPRDESALPGLNAVDSTYGTVTFDSTESSELEIPGFTFDVRKIGERAMLLFPFVTPGLALDYFGLATREEVPDHVRNPLEKSRAVDRAGKRGRPPLVIADAAMQSVIDEAWSRRDRWASFQRIVSLANSYSASDGKLPVLLHSYVQQDGLQPYVDTTIRDPRLWTELGLAADHVLFAGFIAKYVADNPSTKSATELLFLLDQLVQASLDALATLLDTRPDEQLQWTQRTNRSAWNFLADLRRHYTALLERRGLASPGALRAYYDRVRLSILTGILRTTPHGYRASDARFLIGTIYWSAGNRGDALQAWRAMIEEPTDTYVKAYSDVLRAMEEPGGARLVDGILRTERARWLMFSIDRLQHFGFRTDTF
jgi:hypothetical protein